MTQSRTDEFVPLTHLPAPAGPRDFRVSVIPSGGTSRALQASELSGPAQPEPAHCAGKAGEPRISLQYDGDRIASIRVQCACGQVMDLACVYDPPPKSA